MSGTNLNYRLPQARYFKAHSLRDCSLHQRAGQKCYSINSISILATAAPPANKFKYMKTEGAAIPDGAAEASSAETGVSL